MSCYNPAICVCICLTKTPTLLSSQIRVRPESDQDTVIVLKSFVKKMHIGKPRYQRGAVLRSPLISTADNPVSQ